MDPDFRVHLLMFCLAGVPMVQAQTTTSQPRTPRELPLSLVPKIPGGAEALAERARLLMADQRYPQASVLYREMVRQFPKSLYGWSNLAISYHKQKRYNEAFEAVNKALDLNSRDAHSHWLAGTFYMEGGRLDKALMAFMQAKEYAPHESQIYLALGVLFAKRGDFKQAEADLRRAVELNPRLAEAHYNLAWVYALQTPPAKGLARKHYAKAQVLGQVPDAGLDKAIE